MFYPIFARNDTYTYKRECKYFLWQHAKGLSIESDTLNNNYINPTYTFCCTDCRKPEQKMDSAFASFEKSHKWDEYQTNNLMSTVKEERRNYS